MKRLKYLKHTELEILNIKYIFHIYNALRCMMYKYNVLYLLKNYLQLLYVNKIINIYKNICNN